MARTMASLVGVLMLLVGVAGFAAPDLWGMHLAAAHNILFILSGLVAFFYGWKGTPQAARTLCYALGTIYGLLGVIGLLVSGPGQTLNLIPGHLMFGAADHVVHLLLGSLFLLAAVGTRPAVTIDSENQ